MQSSGSTRSSSDGSKRRPCCPPQRPPPCCSGPCLLQVRSTCARSMDGRRSQRSSAASRLTLPPDSILSSCRRSRRAKFQPHSGRHHPQSEDALLLWPGEAQVTLGTEHVAIEVRDPLSAARGDIEVANGGLGIRRNGLPIKLRILLHEICG